MKGAGLCVNENTFYLDHLGIVCSFMDAPVIALEDIYVELAQKYYPNIRVNKIEYDEMTPEYLADNFDVLYLSEYWNIESVQKKFQKRLRVVHCPHGFSDKSYWFDKCETEDIVLVYGQHMLDMFKRMNFTPQRYVLTGNYRYSYFKKNKAFYDKIMQQEVLGYFKKEQPIILYAPTWLDSRESSTFFDACAPLIEKLPSHYNLIVKLHPGLERNDIAQYYYLINTYSHLDNVLFLTDFPPVFPLLNAADIFIGDSSSVGYDFLMLNKPMFFLNKFRENPQETPFIYLYRCGTNIYPEQYGEIYSIIERELPNDKYGRVREEVKRYTFGEERSFEEIKKDIDRLVTS